MHATARGFWAIVLGIGASPVISTPAAVAQGMMNAPGSLGGYGAASSGSFATLGSSGPIIPYAGNFGGFMPYRMGGGSSLSFSSRGTSATGSTRTPFSLSSTTGGLTSMSGGMGRGFGDGLALFVPRLARWDGARRRDAPADAGRGQHERDAAELRLLVLSAAEVTGAVLLWRGHVDVIASRSRAAADAARAVRPDRCRDRRSRRPERAGFVRGRRCERVIPMWPPPYFSARAGCRSRVRCLLA